MLDNLCNSVFVLFFCLGAEQCLRPLLSSTSLVAMPMGQYCNALDTLHECFHEAAEEDVPDDSLKKLALEYSEAILGVIDENVCSFMPQIGEQGT